MIWKRELFWGAVTASAPRLARMFDVFFLSGLLVGFASFFWAATGAVKLMRMNTLDRSRSKQAPLSEPFNALLMPGLGTQGLALRRRVWIGFLVCAFCVAVAVTAAYRM